MPDNASDNEPDNTSGDKLGNGSDNQLADNKLTGAAVTVPATRYCTVYVTTGSLEEATAIGRTLVRERLAACANILPKITSLYWWNGDVETDTETVLILKTRTDHLELLTERVRASHSYDCPCVVAWPIIGGNPDYLAWIAAETDAAASKPSFR